MTSPLRASPGATSSQSRKALYWSPRSPGVRLNGDLLGEAGAERVGAGDDDAVLDAKLKERVAAGAHFREEDFMRHGDLAVLVAALLFVGHLVFDLQRAGARRDHLLGEQIGRLRIAEARIDVGDDRHDMGLKIVDRRQQRLFLRAVAGFGARRRSRGICRRARGHPPGAGRRKSLRSAPARPSSRASTGPARGRIRSGARRPSSRTNTYNAGRSCQNAS